MTAQPDTYANRRAFNVAKTVEIFAYSLMVVGVVAGVVLAIRTRDACGATDAYGTCKHSAQRSHIVFGIGLAIGSIVQMSVIIMVAVYIQARTTGSSTLRPPNDRVVGPDRRPVSDGTKIVTGNDDGSAIVWDSDS